MAAGSLSAKWVSGMGHETADNKVRRFLEAGPNQDPYPHLAQSPVLGPVSTPYGQRMSPMLPPAAALASPLAQPRPQMQRPSTGHRMRAGSWNSGMRPRSSWHGESDAAKGLGQAPLVTTSLDLPDRGQGRWKEAERAATPGRSGATGGSGKKGAGKAGGSYFIPSLETFSRRFSSLTASAPFPGLPPNRMQNDRDPMRRKLSSSRGLMGPWPGGHGAAEAKGGQLTTDPLAASSSAPSGWMASSRSVPSFVSPARFSHRGQKGVPSAQGPSASRPASPMPRSMMEQLPLQLDAKPQPQPQPPTQRLPTPSRRSTPLRSTTPQKPLARPMTPGQRDADVAGLTPTVASPGYSGDGGFHAPMSALRQLSGQRIPQYSRGAAAAIPQAALTPNGAPGPDAADRAGAHRGGELWRWGSKKSGATNAAPPQGGAGPAGPGGIPRVPTKEQVPSPFETVSPSLMPRESPDTAPVPEPPSPFPPYYLAPVQLPSSHLAFQKASLQQPRQEGAQGSVGATPVLQPVLQKPVVVVQTATTGPNLSGQVAAPKILYATTQAHASVHSQTQALLEVVKVQAQELAAEAAATPAHARAQGEGDLEVQVLEEALLQVQRELLALTKPGAGSGNREALAAAIAAQSAITEKLTVTLKTGLEAKNAPTKPQDMTAPAPASALAPAAAVQGLGQARPVLEDPAAATQNPMDALPAEGAPGEAEASASVGGTQQDTDAATKAVDEEVAQEPAAGVQGPVVNAARELVAEADAAVKDDKGMATGTAELATALEASPPRPSASVAAGEETTVGEESAPVDGAGEAAKGPETGAGVEAKEEGAQTMGEVDVVEEKEAQQRRVQWQQRRDALLNQLKRSKEEAKEERKGKDAEQRAPSNEEGEGGTRDAGSNEAGEEAPAALAEPSSSTGALEQDPLEGKKDTEECTEPPADEPSTGGSLPGVSQKEALVLVNTEAGVAVGGADEDRPSAREARGEPEAPLVAPAQTHEPATGSSMGESEAGSAKAVDTEVRGEGAHDAETEKAGVTKEGSGTQDGGIEQAAGLQEVLSAEETPEEASAPAGCALDEAEKGMEGSEKVLEEAPAVPAAEGSVPGPETDSGLGVSAVVEESTREEIPAIGQEGQEQGDAAATKEDTGMERVPENASAPTEDAAGEGAEDAAARGEAPVAEEAPEGSSEAGELAGAVEGPGTEGAADAGEDPAGVEQELEARRIRRAPTIAGGELRTLARAVGVSRSVDDSGIGQKDAVEKSAAVERAFRNWKPSAGTNLGGSTDGGRPGLSGIKRTVTTTAASLPTLAFAKPNGGGEEKEDEPRSHEEEDVDDEIRALMVKPSRLRSSASSSMLSGEEANVGGTPSSSTGHFLRSSEDSAMRSGRLISLGGIPSYPHGLYSVLSSVAVRRQSPSPGGLKLARSTENLIKSAAARSQGSSPQNDREEGWSRLSKTAPGSPVSRTVSPAESIEFGPEVKLGGQVADLPEAGSEVEAVQDEAAGLAAAEASAQTAEEPAAVGGDQASTSEKKGVASKAYVGGMLGEDDDNVNLDLDDVEDDLPCLDAYDSKDAVDSQAVGAEEGVEVGAKGAELFGAAKSAESAESGDDMFSLASSADEEEGEGVQGPETAGVSALMQGIQALIKGFDPVEASPGADGSGQGGAAKEKPGEAQKADSRSLVLRNLLVQFLEAKEVCNPAQLAATALRFAHTVGAAVAPELTAAAASEEPAPHTGPAASAAPAKGAGPRKAVGPFEPAAAFVDAEIELFRVMSWIGSSAAAAAPAPAELAESDRLGAAELDAADRADADLSAAQRMQAVRDPAVQSVWPEEIQQRFYAAWDGKQVLCTGSKGGPMGLGLFLYHRTVDSSLKPFSLDRLGGAAHEAVHRAMPLKGFGKYLASDLISAVLAGSKLWGEYSLIVLSETLVRDARMAVQGRAWALIWCHLHTCTRDDAIVVVLSEGKEQQEEQDAGSADGQGREEAQVGDYFYSGLEESPWAKMQVASSEGMPERLRVTVLWKDSSK